MSPRILSSRILSSGALRSSVLSVLMLPPRILSAGTLPPIALRRFSVWGCAPRLRRERVIGNHCQPFAGQALDADEVAALFGIAERDGGAAFAGATGSADAMHVSLGHVR
jgi:hypothetical protein